MEITNRYVVEKEIGKGAHGCVFKGKDQETGKVVAVKIVQKPFDGAKLETDVDYSFGTDEKHWRDRLRRELNIPRALVGHKNIATVIDHQETSKEVMIVTELIEGPTLLKYRLPTDKKALLDICYQLADAVRFMHSKGIAHRDLKPANIMMSPCGPVIIDFDMSCYGKNESVDKRLKYANDVMGTPNYMAPELISYGRRNVTDFWIKAPDIFLCDLYALGCVFFFVLNGKKLPYSAKLTKDLFVLKLSQPPAASTFDNDRVNNMVDRLMGSNPQNRQTLDEIVMILNDALKSD